LAGDSPKDRRESRFEKGVRCHVFGGIRVSQRPGTERHPRFLRRSQYRGLVSISISGFKGLVPMR
jgi:hypothetical protein